MRKRSGGKKHVHDARPCTTRPESDPHFPRGCGAPSSAPDLARRTWGGQVEGRREPFGAASSWRSMSASRLPDFSGRSADSCCREGPSLDSSGAATELRGGAWVKKIYVYTRYHRRPCEGDRQTDRQFIRARSRIPHDVLSRRSTSIRRLTVRMATRLRARPAPPRARAPRRKLVTRREEAGRVVGAAPVWYG